MAACSRQYVSGCSKRQPAGIEWRCPVHDKSQCCNRARSGLDGNPARHAVDGFSCEFAAKQLVELVLDVRRRQVVEHAGTLSAAVEGHHEARLLRSAAETRHSKAEGSMPPSGDTEFLANMLELRLPDQ